MAISCELALVTSLLFEGGDVSGVDDIGFVNAEKQAGGKLFLHGLESHFGNDPLIFQLENHVIFQSLDKKNILEIYLEITAFGFHEQIIILHFLRCLFLFLP